MANDFRACVCGDHGWARLGHGHVVLCDVSAMEFLATRHWRSLGRKTPRVVTNEVVQSMGPRRRFTLIMSRLLMPTPIGFVVDHINRNPLDNRSKNLRAACIGINSHNRVVVSSTGYKGVSKFNGAFRSMITVGGRQRYLGRFKTAEDAARRYDEEARKLLGSKASLNFERA